MNSCNWLSSLVSGPTSSIMNDDSTIHRLIFPKSTSNWKKMLKLYYIKSLKIISSLCFGAIRKTVSYRFLEFIFSMIYKPTLHKNWSKAVFTLFLLKSNFLNLFQLQYSSNCRVLCVKALLRFTLIAFNPDLKP